MSMMSRDERKDIKRGGRFTSGIRCSFNGLKYSYKNEQSVLIQLPITFLIIIIGILFKISVMEWIIVVLCLGIVLTISLVNTSIEATVDLVTEEYNPIAKIAKDVSASAVLAASLMSVVVGFIIFVPKFISILK